METEPEVRSVNGQQMVVLRDVNGSYKLGSRSLIVENLPAIYGEIVNVLVTKRFNRARKIVGERPFEPEYGSDLHLYLQDPLDQLTAWRIENEVFRAVTRWVPHVAVERRKTIVRPNEAIPGFECQLSCRLTVGILVGQVTDFNMTFRSAAAA
jgi:phage baseplate assembly protein W